MNRRTFLAGTASASFLSQFMSLPALAQSSNGNLLILVTNWGAIDPLAVLQPLSSTADLAYLQTVRPNLLSPNSSIIPLDSRFGFHPEMAPLMSYWNASK